jgi:hypothetical protein
MQHASDPAAARDAIASGLLRLKWLAAAARFQLALRNHADALKANFDPGQPRLPAGERGGGQWVGEGGGATDISATRRKQPKITGYRRYSVRLDEEEERGGHAIRTHVEKSNDELLDVLREDWRRWSSGEYEFTLYKPAQGSFFDLSTANDFVNQVLRDNKELVDKVAEGELDEATLNKRFGYVTGKEAYRPTGDSKPYIRNTYGVLVVIRHDDRAERGFTVRTAYPVNESVKEKKSSP